MRLHCLLLLLPLSTLAAPPPAAALFQKPVISDVVLSPSGKYVGARIVDQNGRTVLAVIDAASRAVTVVAGDRSADVQQFQWVNDTRLAYTLRNQDAASDAGLAPGIFAVDRDGGNFIQLAERDTLPAAVPTHIKRHILPWHTYLTPAGAQDSDDIYVTSSVYADSGRSIDVASVNLLRVDSRSGVAHAIARPGPVQHWWLDNKGLPRLAMTRERTVDTMYYRDPATEEWRTIASFDAYLGGQGVLNPVGFGPDGALYVTRTLQGATARVYRFDVATGKVDPDAVIGAPGYDVDARLVRNRTQLLGADLTTDTRTQVWFDPALQAVQAAVDQALPATVNLLAVAADPAATNVLVESFSDTTPSRYAVFDRTTAQLHPLGASLPQVDPATMGRQRMVSYQARDGLAIPALLTLPPGAPRRHLPLVVLVHGGPYIRGPAWGWSAESQFLATRGYAVLEPHFRGSTGLGYRHYSAGFKQWGLAMQDDLADGVRWAVAQGVADASRVCIAGGSYGGYAVLMGLVRDPGLYRCGVEWNGVTDIGLLYTDSWRAASDVSDDQRQYGMPRMIGDPVQDAAQLAASSPIVQAARITQPLLLAYGGADRRVPLVQGKLFYDKVKQTNPDVTWIDYANEGHGWTLPATNNDFWTRVARFLALHLGPAKADVSKQQSQ